MHYKIFFCICFLIFLNEKQTSAEENTYKFADDEIVIAFGSCNDQNRSQFFWQNINSFKPDIFIMLGDNIYPEKNGSKLNKLAKAYDQLGKNNFYKEFSNSVPIIAIWDDHDYGKNDGGASFPEKDKSRKLFLEFFNLEENKDVTNRSGLYREKLITHNNKLIQIIMLDTRYFKDDFKTTDERGKKGKERYIKDYNKNRTILGKEQWQWFKEKLSKKVDIRIIVSSFQLIASDHGWEKWGNFPLELKKFYSYIETSNFTNTIILSGDRHIGGLYEEILLNKFKLLELTSSSLNKPLSFKVLDRDSKQVGSVVHDANFGIIKINWKNEELIMELRSTLENVFMQKDPFIFKRLKLVNYKNQKVVK